MKIDTDDFVVIAKKAARGAGKTVSKFASAAEIKTGQAIDKAKINYKIVELNSEIRELKVKVGDLVCRAHRGETTSQTALDDLLFELDAKIDERDSLKLRRGLVKQVCPACGKQNPISAKFCNECGEDLLK